MSASEETLSGLARSGASEGGPREALAPPPRGELFADPRLRLVWAAIGELDEGDRYELLDALREDTALHSDRSSPRARQRARGIADVRQAADILHEEKPDAGLTVPEYRRVRAEHPELKLTPDGTLRGWFGGGSWNDVLRAARVAVVPDGDALVREIGGAFSASECVQAVRDYVAEHPDDALPSVQRVCRWAALPEVEARPGRRPTSATPFERHFESWWKVLAAAELVADDGISPALRARGARQVRPRSGRGYSPEQISSDLREVAGRLGRSPKTGEYIREREKIFDEEAEAGLPPRPIASYQCIQGRFATWDHALVKAGLEPIRDPRGHLDPQRMAHGLRVSDEALLDALRRVRGEMAEPLAAGSYKRYRRSQLAEDPSRRRRGFLPSYDTYWKRFGSFDAAMARAFAESEAPEDAASPSS